MSENGLHIPDEDPLDPAWPPSRDWEQATYDGRGAREWSTLTAVRDRLEEKLEDMSPADLHSLCELHERRLEQLLTQTRETNEQLKRTTDLQARWLCSHWMEGQLKTLNMVRWRLRVIEFEVSARAEGWRELGENPPQKMDTEASDLLPFVSEGPTKTAKRRIEMYMEFRRRRDKNPDRNLTAIEKEIAEEFGCNPRTVRQARKMANDWNG